MKTVFNTLLALAVLLVSVPAFAQQTQNKRVVAVCGTLPAGVVYSANRTQYGTVDVNGKDCTTVTVTVDNVSATGAAVPTKAGYLGINIGGNLVGATGTDNGGKKSVDINVTTPASGPTASSAANSVTCDTTVGCGVNLIPTPGKTVNTQAFSGTALATIQSGATGIMGLAIDSGANTDPTWVVLFNAASGSVTLGVTPPVMTLIMPGNASAVGSGHDPIPFGSPISVDFSTALSWACLKTDPWGSTLASSDCHMTIQWKH